MWRRPDVERIKRIRRKWSHLAEMAYAVKRPRDGGILGPGHAERNAVDRDEELDAWQDNARP
jgi:hypothetical protein